jgi:hypothetical protein
MSSITKDENRDDDGEWIVNFKLSIEDVRTLYAYADFYSKHSKDLGAILSESQVRDSDCMKSLLYAMILDYKFCEE